MGIANKPAIIGAGQNFASQLGVHSDSVSDDGYGIVLMPAGIPVDVAIVQSVAAGFKHSVFTLTNGTVIACGDNRSFQIGPGDAQFPGLTRIPIAGRVLQASCGQYYTIYRLDTGSVVVCGWRNPGNPLEIRFDSPAVHAVAGFDSPAVIDSEGFLYLFDSDYQNPPRKHALPRPAFDVAHTSQFSIVATVDGAVFGNGVLNGGLDEFVEVEALRGVRARRVFGSSFNAGIVTRDGEALMSSGATFSRIEALEAQNVVDMAVGLHFALFVTADGKLFSCGHNAFGQLMLGRADKQLVGMTEGPFATIKINAVNCGAHHTFAIANAPPLPHFGALHFSVT
jgi:hypothetical protein